eukprot:434020-Amphidinium_carterae.1
MPSTKPSLMVNIESVSRCRKAISSSNDRFGSAIVVGPGAPSSMPPGYDLLFTSSLGPVLQHWTCIKYRSTDVSHHSNSNKNLRLPENGKKYATNNPIQVLLLGVFPLDSEGDLYKDKAPLYSCLLYTSDAADDTPC